MSNDKFRAAVDKWFGYVLYDLNQDCDIFLDEKSVKDKKYEPFSFKEVEPNVFAITCMNIVVATVIFVWDKDKQISNVRLVIPKINDSQFKRTIFINFLKHKKSQYEVRAKLDIGDIFSDIYDMNKIKHPKEGIQLNLTY